MVRAAGDGAIRLQISQRFSPVDFHRYKSTIYSNTHVIQYDVLGWGQEVNIARNFSAKGSPLVARGRPGQCRPNGFVQERTT